MSDKYEQMTLDVEGIETIILESRAEQSRAEQSREIARLMKK